MTTTHRITRTSAVLLSLAAAAAPTATARPAFDPPTAGSQTPTSVYSRPDKSMVASSSPSPAAVVAKASMPQAVVRVQTPQSGFAWGDAGIGAAGGLAFAMLGVGGGLVISRQRSRRARPTTTLPS